MKSKKIILFILAAILALITAFLIWNIFLKPQPQKEIIPVVEQESALSPVNRDEVKKPEESIQEDYKQETPKQKAVKSYTKETYGKTCTSRKVAGNTSCNKPGCSKNRRAGGTAGRRNCTSSVHI